MDKIPEHDIFIDAIHKKQKVKLSFFSNEDNRELQRTCAPLDYGPSRRHGVIIDGGIYKYHFWDYDSDTMSHILSIPAISIRSISLLGEKFDPAKDFDFDINAVDWFIVRDW